MKAKTLMVQGTASSVGKSVLVAALCRIFQQDGYRVAPFKAQNMALNSFVTADGGEIGRAQAVQAEAAGVAPTVDMNPILLKPEADARSQVIVLGKVQATLSARDYYRYRQHLWGVVRESLERLRSEYDLVIIEGAGSPAEVNLKRSDIANMRLAQLAEAPVLLVGDIDRGGVFASLVGTMELLDPGERRRVRGFVINKFRGDLSLLKPGLDFLERRTGVPVLGVIPYFRDIWVAEEDSVALDWPRPGHPAHALLDIAVVRLPRIANFDDFDPLAQEEGVGVRFVNGAQELGRPDLAILPGTKSTVADLLHLRQVGLAEALAERAREGMPIMGICGGYQMLGQEIADPQGVETAPGKAAGLGLLPVRTVFGPEKATHQVRAVVLAQDGLLRGARGQEVMGYEIHMGLTAANEAPHPFLIVQRSGASVSDPDGAMDALGRICGTYIHGLFHNVGLRRALLQSLAERKGVRHLPWGRIPSREEQYNRLASLVRASLNMPLLCQICGLRG